MGLLEDHPLAAIFPLMGDADLAALAADIEANGLREPVWLFEDKILDGRNRYRACASKDIDHRVERYKGADPLGFVISKNLHRRHLDESQRAMVAARLANLQTPNLPLRQAVEAAAESVSVSPRLVDAARVVEQKATPELVAAVDKGEVSVSAAAVVAKLPKAEQKKAVAAGKVKEKAKQQREKRPASKKSAPGQPIVITEADEQEEKARRAAPVDGTGKPIPPALRDTFFDGELGDTIAELGTLLAALDARYQRVIRSLSKKPYKFCDFSKITDKLNQIVNPKSGLLPQVIDHLKAGEPFAVCTCRGEDRTHADCRTGGYLPAWRYQELKGTEA